MAIAPDLAAPPLYDDGRVLLGCDEHGQPVYWVAHDGDRPCNGAITGSRAGYGRSNVVERLVHALLHGGDWTVTRVDADVLHADEHAFDALEAAEALTSGHYRPDAPHLLIWDGLDRLLRDPALLAHHFGRRVDLLADIGPRYGVAQLAITGSLGVEAFGCDTHLRAALTRDNLVALPTSGRERHILHGLAIAPANLPDGHAAVAVGRRITQVDLITGLGLGAANCPSCWRDADASTATRPLLRDGGLINAAWICACRGLRAPGTRCECGRRAR